MAIRVDGLSKRYRIGGKQERYKALRDTLTDAFVSPFRKAGKLLRGEATGAAALNETIWALKDVSFEVKHGEVVGIIGRNGAGKTTLLKILSRITEPTEGYIDIYGRVGSLLEVGTGFHPELTGRENIYLNGAILGMQKAEIERKFDEMVAFAEIEKFIDTPVKHYSSGMYVRLAFAVAAHLEPEILLVDEVLAVGDAAFQKKCLGKMGDVAKEGRTVLFVSHNMGAVRSLCSTGILLENGTLSVYNQIDSVVSHYMGRIVLELPNDGVHLKKSCEYAKVTRIAVEDTLGNIRSTFYSDEPICVRVAHEVLNEIPEFRIWLRVTTTDDVDVFSTNDSKAVKRFLGTLRRMPGQYESTCIIPKSLLNVGSYLLSIGLGNSDIPTEPIASFKVLEAGEFFELFPHAFRGVIRHDFNWEVQRLISCHD
ncbi:MAG: ABC transporter ATP-binding protein [bacterium]